MTDERHRYVGRMLGFPDCCVEYWINDPFPHAGIRRGSVRAKRSDAEIQKAKELGGNFTVGDCRVKEWVPCPNCMYSPGWTPYVDEDAYIRQRGNIYAADSLAPEVPQLGPVYPYKF